MNIKRTDERTAWSAAVDEEAEYRAFVDSVTVSSEEMEVLVSMPNISSIAEAKRYLCTSKEPNPPAWPGHGIRHVREHAIAWAHKRLSEALSRYHLWSHGHHHG